MLSEIKTVSRKITKEKVTLFLEKSGFMFNLDSSAQKLTPEEMVVLDILKHIYCKPKLLVIDEILDKLEGLTLQKIMKLLIQLKEMGSSILIISHKIDTFYNYVDMFSIIRKGEIIITRSVSNIDRLSLIKLAYTNTQKQEHGDLSNVDFKRLLRANFNILVDIPIILIFLDDQYDLVLASNLAKNYFSRPNREDTGIPFRKFLGDDALYNKIRKSLMNEDTNQIYNIPVTLNGEKRITDIIIFPVKVDSFKMGNIIFINDITEKESLKQQIVLKEKLSSVGLLAMGVAHEINNPLDIILKCIDLLQLSKLDIQQKELVNDIETEVDLASTIVKSLVTTTDNTKDEDILFDFNDLLKTIVKQVTHLASTMDIRFIIDFVEDSMIIKGNKVKAKLVILDLIKNSFEAMEKAGTIRLSTKIFSVKGKPFLNFRIEDDGKGIDIENIDDIFLPFFSTKGSTGKNMGLGLYNSYNMIQEMNGLLSIDSSKEKGSAFEIVLPLLNYRGNSKIASDDISPA
jgi:signal transduction histidine kinase